MTRIYNGKKHKNTIDYEILISIIHQRISQDIRIKDFFTSAIDNGRGTSYCYVWQK